MNRGLFYFFLGCHLLSILAYNVHSTVRGYLQLSIGSGSGYLQRTESVAATVTSWLPIRIFAQCAGTATGYGFFAPQVGSSFRLDVSVLDPEGRVQATSYLPPLKQPHSLLRYHSLLSRMQQLANDSIPVAAVPSLKSRQIRAIAHCLAQRIALHLWRTPSGTPLRCEVSAFSNHYRVPIYQKELTIPSPIL